MISWPEAGLIVLGAAAVTTVTYASIRIYRRRKAAANCGGAKSDSLGEFVENADKFSGLYEPLYRMDTGKTRFRAGTVGDWVTRMENLQNSPHYIEEWKPRLQDFEQWTKEDGLSKIHELMQFVSSAGVCRDTAENLVIDSETYKKYSTIDGELIEQGTQAAVKSPYWYVGDKVLEKGYIQSIYIRSEQNERD